jgi:hypothetical protein
VKVNKISLKQMGGQAQNQNVDPQLQQITEFISSSLEGGDNPVDIVNGLVQQQVDQQMIAQAFMTVGYKEEDVVSLFEQVQQQAEPAGPPSAQEQTKDPQEITRNQALEAEAQEAGVQQEQEMIGQQDAMAQTLMGKSGIEIKPENKGKFTEWAEARDLSVPGAYNKVMGDTTSYPPSVVKMANFAKNAGDWKKQEGGESNATDSKETKAQNFYNNTGIVKREDKFTLSPNYINPLAFESNDNFNGSQVVNLLVDGYDDLLSSEEDKNGIKKGTFRDWNKKKGLEEERKGGYYNYKLNIDKNDSNKYAFDNTDLYNTSNNNGSLRNLETFTNDVNENSRVNFNTETGGYDSLLSSRKINENIHDGNNAFDGENLNYFNNVDEETRKMILSTQNDPEGVTLGINEKGQSTSYLNKGDNPYYYNTMMGRNTLGEDRTPRPKVEPISTIEPKGFDLSMFTNPQTPPNSMIPTKQQGMFAHGGSLPKAQFNLPDDMFGLLSQNQLSNPQEFNDLIMNGMTTPDYNTGSQMAADGLLQKKQPALGPTPYEQQTANALQTISTRVNQPLVDEQPSYDDPNVTRTNKFQGGYNRFMDSQEVKAFGDVSEFAVAGAGVINNWFEDQAINDARVDNRNNLVADSIYGVNEDPFMKRGAWDINTGTFGSEGQRTVRTNMGTAKRGKEIGNESIDIDSTLLAKLIAAGADIEIL